MVLVLCLASLCLFVCSEEEDDDVFCCVVVFYCAISYGYKWVGRVDNYGYIGIR